MPATEPATDKNAPFRGAVLTVFDPAWVENTPCDLPDSRITFFAFGVEVCPWTGRKHLQAYAYADRAMRLSAWKKSFPGAHISQTGTPYYGVKWLIDTKTPGGGAGLATPLYYEIRQKLWVEFKNAR